MTTKETRTFGPEIFFSYYDAVNWLSNYIEYGQTEDGFVVKEAELKLMPSGGYRVGVIFVKQESQND